MTPQEHLIRGLAALEADARRLASDAATAGEFHTVAELALLAKDIVNLLARWQVQYEGVAPLAPSRPVEGERESGGATCDDAESAQFHAGDSAFPKFLRQGNELVKLGWSPSDRRAYEHRAAKEIVDRVARMALTRGRQGLRFTMDALLKALRSHGGGKAIPSYQVYATMSWLKWSGMVVQHGRQGYTIVRPQTFADSLVTAWQALPTR